LFILIKFILIFLIEQRKQEAEKIRAKYPERIPVIKKQSFLFEKINIFFLLV
jgi:hypothetical protein